MENLQRTNGGEIQFRNAQWTPIDTINVQVLIKGEWHDYHCTDYDDVPHGIELWNLLSTTYINQVTACPESVKYEWAASDILSERNSALRDTDWIACVDVALVNQNDWIEYRRQWRDITEQVGYPFDVQLPIRPAITRNTYKHA